MKNMFFLCLVLCTWLTAQSGCCEHTVTVVPTCQEVAMAQFNMVPFTGPLMPYDGRSRLYKYIYQNNEYYEYVAPLIDYWPPILLDCDGNNVFVQSEERYETILEMGTKLGLVAIRP